MVQNYQLDRECLNSAPAMSSRAFMFCTQLCISNTHVVTTPSPPPSTASDTTQVLQLQCLHLMCHPLGCSIPDLTPNTTVPSPRHWTMPMHMYNPCNITTALPSMQQPRHNQHAQEPCMPTPIHGGFAYMQAHQHPQDTKHVLGHMLVNHKVIEFTLSPNSAEAKLITQNSLHALCHSPIQPWELLPLACSKLTNCKHEHHGGLPNTSFTSNR